MVVNNTIYNIRELSIYSKSLKDLKSNDSISFKNFNFNSSIDDSVLSFSVNNKSFMSHIKFPKKKKKHYYSIDSLNLKNKVIFLKNR
jgi:hypothetical protein